MNKFYFPLAAILLLCLAPMPYGFFQLVRFLSTLAFGVMAFRYYQERKETQAYTFGTLALLFQPFYKIALGRTVWNIVDVVVAIGLIVLFFWERKQGNGQKINRPDVSEQPLTVETVEDNRFEFRLNGKLSPNELIYVASEEDKALSELFETKPEIMEGWAKMIGFHIIYLPLLVRKLKDKRVLQYRAPYLSDAELKDVAIGNDFMLQYIDNLADRKKIKQGLVRTEDIHRGIDGKDRVTNRFYPLSSISGETIADQLERIGNQISVERSRKKQYLGNLILNYDERENNDSEPPSELGFSSQIEVESTDDLMDEVRERIAKLRQRGIAEYILEQLIHPDNRLSRMVITKDWRILLPDYNGMEIKMEPLVKAVYLLFLRHPEGIVFKHLPDYRQELTNIYSNLRPFGLSDKAIQSIDDVTNPLLNSINEKCARIRGAFVGLFDNYMAKSYYVDGLRGEAKKISLPRNLVSWE